jgi:hypothetical protein
MDGNVDAARQQRILDFLGEQALAADFREGAVLNPVAGGFDDVDFGVGQGGMGGFQRRFHHFRLRQGKRRTARADPHSLHGFLVSPLVDPCWRTGHNYPVSWWATRWGPRWLPFPNGPGG